MRLETRNTQGADLGAVDETDWALRSGYWLSKSVPKIGKQRRSPQPKPMVLCGHGALLRIDQGALLVRNGFTHYPQKREEHRLFPGDPNLPERIVLLEGSGALTFDVLDWLSKQGIPLVRIDWRGNVVCAIGGNGYAANPYRVQWQLETSANNEKRMAWSNALIARKIESCIKTLEKAIPKSPAWELAMRRAYADLTRLELDPPPGHSNASDH